jgi:cytochrome c556
MKKMLWFACASLLLVSVLMAAINESELEKKMKSAGDAMGGIRKGMQANAMPQVATNAKAMVAALEGTESFWAERHANDGVKYTQEGLAAAKELVAAAEAGHGDHAKSAAAKLGGSCKGCHDAHREKLPDGKYKIK